MAITRFGSATRITHGSRVSVVTVQEGCPRIAKGAPASARDKSAFGLEHTMVILKSQMLGVFAFAFSIRFAQKANEIFLVSETIVEVRIEERLPLDPSRRRNRLPTLNHIGAQNLVAMSQIGGQYKSVIE
jgi:hypothetical protein